MVAAGAGKRSCGRYALRPERGRARAVVRADCGAARRGARTGDRDRRGRGRRHQAGPPHRQSLPGQRRPRRGRRRTAHPGGVPGAGGRPGRCRHQRGLGAVGGREHRRGELGFTGVIISDALEMRAVSDQGGVPSAAVRAVAAGVDLLCLGRDQDEEDYLAVRAALTAAVTAGELPAARLEEAGGAGRPAPAALAAGALPGAGPGTPGLPGPGTPEGTPGPGAAVLGGAPGAGAVPGGAPGPGAGTRRGAGCGCGARWSAGRGCGTRRGVGRGGSAWERRRYRPGGGAARAAGQRLSWRADRPAGV